MAKGILIAIDGLDGSGKETQSKLLCRRLEEEGIKNRLISFPTYENDSCALVNMYLGGRFGEDPSAVNAYAASSFYAMDRYCSYMLDWKKDYENGVVIIANRYTSANMVHQMSKLPRDKWIALRVGFGITSFLCLACLNPARCCTFACQRRFPQALYKAAVKKRALLRTYTKKTRAFLKTATKRRCTRQKNAAGTRLIVLKTDSYAG